VIAAKPSRSEILSQLGPRGWWVEHSAAPRAQCGCTPDGPGKTCDLGEALWRLRKAEIGVRRVPPGRRHR
jgi:hypothetical protein